MYGKSQDEIEFENRKAIYKDYLRWKKIVAAKMGWAASDPRLNAGLINSERANQMTVIAATQINMHIVKVPYRTGVQNSGWHKDAVHYQVRIWVEGNEKNSYVFSYSQGSGIKQFPTIREILFSFVQDALAGAESFANYCGNFGGDEDSRTTFKNYEQCVEVFDWFRSNRIWESRVTGIAQLLQEAENAGDINSDPPVLDEENEEFERARRIEDDFPEDNNGEEIPF